MTPPPHHTVRRAVLACCGVFAAYLALSIAITWPLALRLGTAVPHDLGDPVGFTWILWWNAHALPFTTAWRNAPFFYPSPGAIVFQDSLLGVWPFTTAVQLLGGSPLAAYNLLVIGSFALSAFTAYLLCARLTGDRRAAFAGGAVFGFALYRMAQLPHVNILLTFWVPLILLGLHAYLGTRRSRWLALAAACWAMQGLTSGYFLAYSSVLVGLWALFFLRAQLKDYARLATAFGVALAAIWPWLSVYRSVHAVYGFQRSVGDAEFWAADVSGLWRAPALLAIWGSRLGAAVREEQFFPGLTLASACLLAVLGSRYFARPFLSRASRWLLAVAAAFGALAAISALGPPSASVLGIHVSLGRPYKPLTWMWLSLLLALFLSPPIRRLARDRSVAGFYSVAALVLWIFALGPTARFMGTRIWYKAPYSWLLLLPGFDAVRVPARFWLLVVLALAIVVAHGLASLRARGWRAAPAAAAVVCAGLLAEAWPAGLPLLAPPERFAFLESRSARTPVLELPLGHLELDLAAMYRSMYHRAPVVNGYSAYAPASFANLVAGLSAGDPGALVPFSELMPLDIVVHTGTDEAEVQAAAVKAAGARTVYETDRIRLYHLPNRDPIREPLQSPAAAVLRVTSADGGDVTSRLTDDDPFTFVSTSGLDVALTRRCRVDEVELGAAPGLIRVAVHAALGASIEQELWSGSVAEQIVRAALAHPRLPRARLRFTPTETDRLRIDLGFTPQATTAPILEVRVLGEGCMAR
jgi:hypothetical protein